MAVILRVNWKSLKEFVLVFLDFSQKRYVLNVFLSECRLRPFLSEENFLKTFEKNSCSGVKLYPTSGSDIFGPRSVPGQYLKTWTLNRKEDVVTVAPKKG